MSDTYIDHVRVLMLTTLEVAVPLWQARIVAEPWRLRDISSCAANLAVDIASHGDVVQFKGTKKGESARVFNACAESLALMSFMPGGVTFCGRTWIGKLPGGTS